MLLPHRHVTINSMVMVKIRQCTRNLAAERGGKGQYHYGRYA